RIAAIARNPAGKKRLTVRGPGEDGSSQAVDVGSGQAANPAGSGFDDPEFDAGLDGVGEGQFGAVGRPLRVVDAGDPGKGDLAALAGVDPEKGNAAIVGDAARAIGRGVDSVAGEREFRLGEFFDWRQVGTFEKRDPFAV